jgi:hypothetical protein
MLSGWQRIGRGSRYGGGRRGEIRRSYLYRGCVGTELYEFAATVAPAPHTLR